VWLSEDPLGDVDSPNVFAFVAHRPHMHTDPEGEAFGWDNLLGGVLAVGVGYGATCLFETCDQYDWKKDAPVDFGLGFASSGLSSLKYLKVAKGAPLAGNALRLGGRVGAQFALGLTGEVARKEWKGEDYTAAQLAWGAAFSAGIGEGGGIGARGVSRFGRWAAGRLGQSEARLGRFIATDLQHFQWNGTPRGAGGRFVESPWTPIRNTATRLGRAFRRHLSIEDHHLINQATLTGTAPHPLVQVANSLGINIIRAPWNIKTMFHRGGHSTAYFKHVRGYLDDAWSHYVSGGASWDAFRMEAELRTISDQLRSDIFWLRVRLY